SVGAPRDRNSAEPGQMKEMGASVLLSIVDGNLTVDDGPRSGCRGCFDRRHNGALTQAGDQVMCDLGQRLWIVIRDAGVEVLHPDIAERPNRLLERSEEHTSELQSREKLVC